LNGEDVSWTKKHVLNIHACGPSISDTEPCFTDTVPGAGCCCERGSECEYFRRNFASPSRSKNLECESSTDSLVLTELNPWRSVNLYWP
jgi:hypothetical protein